MDINQELEKIKEYIKKEFDLDTYIDEYLHGQAVYYKKGDYKMDIHIGEPSKNSFAPNDYLIHFGHWNKKEWSGGGYAEIYKRDDYSDIDKFLKQQGFEKVKERQISIFEVN